MPEQATAVTPSLDADIATVSAIKAEMRTSLIERDVETELLVLSAVACVHGLLIGPGGVAKSMAAENFCERIVGVNYFSEQFRKDLPVEALVGNVSVKGLVEDDTFRYVTRGMLPEANVAHLDEIWKGNGVVLNAMLKMLNERKFKSNGQWHHVPLWFAIGASNELPTEQALMALRDRFAWTRMVEPVKTDEGFKTILRGQVERNAGTGVATTPTTIDRDAIERLQAATKTVTVPDDVLAEITSMRRKAEVEASLHVSARRYGEGVKLCQARALLAGRTEVSSDDLTIFQHVLWTDEEDVTKAFDLTLDYAGRVARAASKLRDAFDPLKVDLDTIRREQIANGGIIEGDTVTRLSPLSMEIRKVSQLVEAEITDAKGAGRETTELDSLLAEVMEARRVIREDIMG